MPKKGYGAIPTDDLDESADNAITSAAEAALNAVEEMERDTSETRKLLDKKNNKKTTGCFDCFKFWGKKSTVAQEKKASDQKKDRSYRPT